MSAYPATEERVRLAKELGMTSRSVQIWVNWCRCNSED